MRTNKPIYEQLMDSIKKKIISGELQIGDRLQSERYMAEHYGINRMTVRNAIKHLIEEDIVESKQGKGNFVINKPKIEEKIVLGTNEKISLSMQIRNIGMQSDRQIISFKKIIPEGEIRDNFPNEALVYELIRLSLVNKKPYALQKTYIPTSIFKEAERFNFENFSLYDYMEDQNHRPKKITSYLKIEPLPDDYLSILNIDEGQNIFHFDYLSYDSSNQLVEYTISYHHPEYTSFKTTSYTNDLS